MVEAILVVNHGSTSIKIDLTAPDSGQCLGSLRVERLGSGDASYQLNGGPFERAPDEPVEALRLLVPRVLNQERCVVIASGHRIVHGGPMFSKPTLLDAEVIDHLETVSTLAPLHNPPAILGIKTVMSLLPTLQHVAVFDTGFHHTIPEHAITYALPRELVKKHGLRRYGFHGISHQFTAEKISARLAKNTNDLKLVVCHLGGGCSVCAIKGGRSVATSMGMTPLEGLVMATRSGDIDPAIPLKLLKMEGYGIDELEEILTQKSGIFGMTDGISDFRDLELSASSGVEACQLALDVFCHQLLKSIGSHLAILNQADALVFTGGIGENSTEVRSRICKSLSNLGVQLDVGRNASVDLSDVENLKEITKSESPVRVYVSRSNEAWAIAKLAKEKLMV